MRKLALSNFECPKCRGNLALGNQYSSDHRGHVREAELLCESCRSHFPIRQYIPRMVSNYNYTKSFGFQWKKHVKTQLDKFNGFTFSRDRFYAVTGWPTRLHGERVLEAGSGAGCFTQIICETGCEVYSFDFSEAVDANWDNNGDYENLHLFQADIYNIPLKVGMFDKIFCFGVLQHTPDPKGAFLSLLPFLKPGGEIVIDVYDKSFPRIFQWKYLLRPITKRMDRQRLYQIIETVVPMLLPLSAWLRKLGGHYAARGLLPIIGYSHLPIPKNLARDWSILDTFDMYSPEYDYPQTLRTVRGWFENAELTDVSVRYGPNGINGSGRRAELQPKKEKLPA